jgi:acetolactate synthase-1/2/3 large subunit
MAIRRRRARDYPGHTIATDLTNPDFVALAQSFGAWGRRVETTEAFSGGAAGGAR